MSKFQHIINRINLSVCSKTVIIKDIVNVTERFPNIHIWEKKKYKYFVVDWKNRYYIKLYMMKFI